MKSRQKDSGRAGAGAKRRELKLKIALAQKRAEATRTLAQTAKAGFKSARKTFKKAKKLAREARKKLKTLKKALIKAVQAARKLAAAARKKAQRVSSPKPVGMEPAVQPAKQKSIDKLGAKKSSAARTTRPTVRKRQPVPGVAASGLKIIAPEPILTPAATPPKEVTGASPAILFPPTNSQPTPPAA
jgi:hypothetical protein